MTWFKDTPMFQEENAQEKIQEADYPMSTDLKKLQTFSGVELNENPFKVSSEIFVHIFKKFGLIVDTNDIAKDENVGKKGYWEYLEQGEDGRYYDKETGKSHESVEEWKRNQENLAKRYESMADFYERKAKKEWDYLINGEDNGKVDTDRGSHYSSFGEYCVKNNEYRDKADKIWDKVENTYSSLDSMKNSLGKSYKEIKENKPPNSPNIAKWFENGGTLKVEKIEQKDVWTYIDNEGREVSYVDGYPVFPPEAKHPIIGDINIGEFTGDRNEDKRRYLEKLEEQYGLTEIPEGYVLHHDSKNGNMQLIKSDWHKEFTHTGGHSRFKEG